MSYKIKDDQTSGLKDTYFLRNQYLEKINIQRPIFYRSETTIAGFIYKHGIILGADTRSLSENLIVEKNCSKIHCLTKNIYCCGSGVAGDIQKTLEIISAQIKLNYFNGCHSQVRVKSALYNLKNYLYQYKGEIQAAFIVGGVDITGPQIYNIYPHGSYHTAPYVTMGSGSLAAIGKLENDWRPNLTEVQAIKLMRNTISLGILNDLSSGSNIDICIIRKNGTQCLKSFENIGSKPQTHKKYTYNKNTTSILKLEITELEDIQ